MEGFDEDTYEIVDPVKPPEHEALEARMRESEGMFAKGVKLDPHTLAALMTDRPWSTAC